MVITNAHIFGVKNSVPEQQQVQIITRQDYANSQFRDLDILLKQKRYIYGFYETSGVNPCNVKRIFIDDTCRSDAH